jgi:ADP-heptose:LPS heptosyltransferase
MFASLLDKLMVKIDTLLERFYRHPEEREAISFRRYITDPRKILLIPGENLADLALTAPFISPTLERFPQVEVCVLVPPLQACLIEDIGRVRAIPCPHRSSHSLDTHFRKITSALQQENFDWAVNMSFSSARPEALLTYYSGAKIRTGLPSAGSEIYYNLIIKDLPAENGFIERFSHLFRALQVSGPFETAAPLIKPTEQESSQAALFLRHRKRETAGGKFAGCVMECSAGQKSLVQNLHDFMTNLTRSLGPYNQLIASNLIPDEEKTRLEALSAYVHQFKNLRNMLATLALCDKVITNSVGLACLAGRLGARVELLETDKSFSPRLEPADRKNISLFNSKDGLFAQPQTTT